MMMESFHPKRWLLPSMRLRRLPLLEAAAAAAAAAHLLRQVRVHGQAQPPREAGRQAMATTAPEPTQQAAARAANRSAAVAVAAALHHQLRRLMMTTRLLGHRPLP